MQRCDKIFTVTNFNIHFLLFYLVCSAASLLVPLRVVAGWLGAVQPTLPACTRRHLTQGRCHDKLSLLPSYVPPLLFFPCLYTQARDNALLFLSLVILLFLKTTLRSYFNFRSEVEECPNETWASLISFKTDFDNSADYKCSTNFQVPFL